MGALRVGSHDGPTRQRGRRRHATAAAAGKGPSGAAGRARAQQAAKRRAVVRSHVGAHAAEAAKLTRRCRSSLQPHSRLNTIWLRSVRSPCFSAPSAMSCRVAGAVSRQSGTGQRQEVSRAAHCVAARRVCGRSHLVVVGLAGAGRGRAAATRRGGRVRGNADPKGGRTGRKGLGDPMARVAPRRAQRALRRHVALVQAPQRPVFCAETRCGQRRQWRPVAAAALARALARAVPAPAAAQRLQRLSRGLHVKRRRNAARGTAQPCSRGLEEPEGLAGKVLRSACAARGPRARFSRRGPAQTGGAKQHRERGKVASMSPSRHFQAVGPCS